MEITFNRKTLTNILGFLLIITVLAGGYAAWTNGWFDRWMLGTKMPQPSPESDPAILSLAALYSPSGEKAEWEEQVCRGMTEKGCQIFTALYADPVWKSEQGKAASVSFIEIAETLDDKSQVWKTEVTLDGESTLVYLHVTENEAGQWFLNRVLFAQEAAKYTRQ